jgi:SP family sugar:H+ symporter-like MFS transporter
MRFLKSRNAEHSNTSTAVPSEDNSVDLPTNGNGIAEKSGAGIGGKIPGVTLSTVFMAILVAMGGFIFGYDTGQISGFLEMPVFLERFGEHVAVSKEAPTGYAFSNVRSGLIVAMVSLTAQLGLMRKMLTIYSCQLVLSSDA